MRAVLAGRPARQFVEPPGLVRQEVCALSGRLPSPQAPCPHRVTEVFLAGTEPAQTDLFYQAFRIDMATGLLASENTPENQVIEKVFLVLPPEAEEWARQAGIPRPPEPLPGTAGPGASGLAILAPDPSTIFHITPLLPADSQRVRFSAISAVPLRSLRFVLNGRPLATLDAPPYEFWWRLEPGEYQLEVLGVDVEGNEHRGEAVAFRVIR